MSVLRQVGRYVGGATALAGLLVATAFVGRRTADPVAGLVFGPLSLVDRVGGVLGGLALLALGLFAVGRSAPRN